MYHVLTKISIHRLNQSEQRELNQRLEKRQMKEMMTVRLFSGFYCDHAHSKNTPSWTKLICAFPQMYSKLVQRCFDDCVNDFTTKSLQSREEGCVMRCFDKSMKGGERIQQRFQEQNAQPMGGGKLGP